MGKRALAISLAVAAVAAAAAWVLRGETAPGTVSGTAAPPASVGAAESAPREVGPGPASVRAGHGVRGAVLRNRAPAAATVRAYRLAGPPRDASDAAAAWLHAALGTGGVEGVRAETSAGSDGAWTLAGLEAGEWLFQAVAPDGACGVERAAVPAPVDGTASADGVTIALDASGGPLAVRATLPGGAPFDGPLLLFSGLRAAAPPAERLGPGRYVFPAVPRGVLQVAALLRGTRIVAGPDVLTPCEVEVPFEVGAGDVAVTGVVLAAADGSPVEGAEVVLRSDPAPGRAATDARGAFRLDWPTRGSVLLVATAPGFLSDSEFLPEGPARGDTVGLHLQRPGKVTGRVVLAETGEPVEGAPVVVAGVVTTSGRDGGFAVAGVRPGEHLPPLVAGGGFVSACLADGSAPASLSVPEGGAVRVDLPVVPGPRLRGRAVDASGEGIAGLDVEVETLGDRFPWRAMDRDPLSFELRHAGVTSWRGRTGPDGRFDGPTLLPRKTGIVAIHRDGVPVAVASVPPAGAAREVATELRVPDATAIDIAVVAAEDGEPLSAVELVVWAMHAVGGGSAMTFHPIPGRATTGADGVARGIAVPGSPLRIGLAIDGGGWGDEGGAVTARPPFPSPVLLRVPRAALAPRWTLEGTVVGDDGSPRAGVSCTVTSEPHADGGASGAVTDFRGRFRAEGLGGESVTVTASHVDPQHPRVTGVATRHAPAITLRLPDAPPPAPSLSVHVVDADGGSVARGLVHFLFRRGGDGGPRPGGAKLRELVSGRASAPWRDGVDAAWVHVGRAVRASPGHPPLADAAVGPFVPGGGEVRIVLRASRPLEGRVTDSGGRAVPGEGVVVEPLLEGVGPAGTAVAILRTDEEGRFRYDGAGTVPFLLRVHPTGGPPVEVRLAPGDTAPVLVLPRPR